MRRWLVLVSASFHIALVFGLFIAGFWKLERLDRPHISVAIGTPLPPPPAPAGGASPSKAPTFTHKHLAPVPVQPEPHPVEAAKPVESTTGGGGEGSGSGSGKGSGDPDSPGECTENCGAGSGSASKPVEKPPCIDCDQKLVPPSVIRGLRISGETQIHPADLDKTAMSRDGKDRVIASFKTCVTPRGDVGSVAMLKSSGYPAYDQEIAAAMRAWRYHPYVIGSQAVTACGIVTFVYQIK